MMNPFQVNTVGQKLRQLRRQRGLTLKETSSSLGMSAPVLSRKERGKQAFERREIRAIIERFGLTPREAYELWLMAGFIPEAANTPVASTNVRAYARRYLPMLGFPAYILNVAGYLVAWNQELETIFRLSRLGIRPLHLLDMAFAPPEPEQAIESWERYQWQMVQMVHRWLPRMASDPHLGRLLDMLSQRYGTAFEQCWQSLQNNDAGQHNEPASGALLVPLVSPAGIITSLALRSVVPVPQDYELVVLVPLGKENQARYQQLSQTMPSGRLYFQDLSRWSGVQGR